MGRKKKDKNNIDQEQIDLIPVESQPKEETEVDAQSDVESENPEVTAEDISDASPETELEVESIETEAESAEPESPEVAAEDTSAQPKTPEEESESSALFGAYVAEENKWERKNRIKDEKIKAKQEKKRAKYADVDDDTYEQMKAGGAHKFFGVLSLMMLIVGIAAVALFVYRLVIAPSYAQVGEKEKNLHVEGFATETDTSKYEQQVTALQGIATPSDLTDTWVEQPFEQATPSDVSAQDTEDADTLPADDAEAKPVVID